MYYLLGKGSKKGSTKRESLLPYPGGSWPYSFFGVLKRVKKGLKQLKNGQKTSKKIMFRKKRTYRGGEGGAKRPYFSPFFTNPFPYFIAVLKCLIFSFKHALIAALRVFTRAAAQESEAPPPPSGHFSRLLRSGLGSSALNFTLHRTTSAICIRKQGTKWVLRRKQMWDTLQASKQAGQMHSELFWLRADRRGKAPWRGFKHLPVQHTPECECSRWKLFNSVRRVPALPPALVTQEASDTCNYPPLFNRHHPPVLLLNWCTQ